MSFVDVIFRGVREAGTAMTALEERVGGAAREAVMEAAHFIEAGAKANAPVQTGSLRRSIHVLGPTPFGFAGWVALVGPSVVYGRRIELGFQGSDSLGRQYDQEGQPYLQPAYDAAMSGAMQSIFYKHYTGALRG